MEALREYVLSVAAAGILCGILKSILGEKGAAGGTVKLICGLFLAFTVIRPIANIQLSDFAVFTSSISQDAREAVSRGEKLAQESRTDIIKAETEAYILDKAKALNAILQAEVTVGTDGIPAAVCITGQWSPYARVQLAQILTEELGIAKEDQTWIASA